jgi:hypothetical protein
VQIAFEPSHDGVTISVRTPRSDLLEGLLRALADLGQWSNSVLFSRRPCECEYSIFVEGSLDEEDRRAVRNAFSEL